MKEMSREASELVHAGREAFRPTESDRARLMAAVTGAATLSVGVAAAASAERLSGIFSVVHGARLLAIALPVAAGGAYWWHASQSPDVQTTFVSPPALVAPAPAKPPVQVAEQAASELPSPLPSAAPERPAPAGEPFKAGNQIREEVALLSKAQAALSRGRAQEALDALSEHSQRFPRGALSEERAATRARTLCALGRTKEAEAELTRMARLNPASAYLARARESCGSR